jgi:molybdopterin/thiamine biosynthesis adenylyltransferase
LDAQLQAQILAASQPLRVPGSGEQRVLSPVAVERLAADAAQPRWHVEALALELGVTPLHYLRNLARFRAEGQTRLLRASVALVGRNEALARAAERLAGHGVGSLTLLAPVVGDDEPAALRWAEGASAAALNRNASCAVAVHPISLKGGNPGAALRGVQAIAACLDDSMEEQLLQFACRMGKLPLALAGIEETRGQATTVLPGDAGVALVYKPSHPHLEPKRDSRSADPKASLMAGTWLAEQVVHLLLDEGDLLRNRLLYADMATGQMAEYPL